MVASFKKCGHQRGRCDRYSCRILHVDQTRPRKVFFSIALLEDHYVVNINAQYGLVPFRVLKLKIGVNTNGQATACTELDAGKYDTLLEVVNRKTLMVWTCGDSEILAHIT